METKHPTIIHLEDLIRRDNEMVEFRTHGGGQFWEGSTHRPLAEVAGRCIQTKARLYAHPSIILAASMAPVAPAMMIVKAGFVAAIPL
jgi:hypothetical protein